MNSSKDHIAAKVRRRAPEEQSEREESERSQGETIVLKPSPLMVLPRTVLAILLMAIIDYLAVLYPWMMVNIGSIPFFGFEVPIEFPILHLFPLAILLSAVHKLYNERYYIDEVCVMERTGIISFKRRNIELDYCNMRASEVDQNWYESLCNEGRILLGTSGSGLGTITMQGIKDPFKYNKIIEKRMLRARHDPVESDSVFVPGKRSME